MSVHAQEKNKIDSLNAEISEADGIMKFDPLISKVRLLAESDYNEALVSAKEAFEIAREFGDSAKMVQSGRMCGQLLNYLDKRNEAIQFLLSVQGTADRNGFKNDYKIILINLANAYTFKSQYDHALDLHFKVLGLSEDDNDLENIGFALNNIGLTYYKLKNYKEAVKYYEKALDLQRKSDGYEIERLLINLGLCHNQLANFEAARLYFSEALDHCKDACQKQILLDANLGIGISFFHTGDLTGASEKFLVSHDIAKKSGNIRYVAENLLWMSRVSLAKGNDINAIEQLKEAEVLATNLGYNELLIDAYDRLSSIYDRHSDHVNFSTYIKKYVALKDQVYNEQVMESLAKSKADYEQRENLAIIKANEMTIAQQKRLYTAAMIIAVLAGLLVIVLLYANRAIKQVNKKLSNAQDVIFDQNKKLGIRNQELDRLVEKKTEELKLVNLTLKQMNEELDTFIKKSAEDIRAPLASLRGICHVALLDISDKASLMYLNKISKTTELLNAILKRLLELNKINHAKPSLTEIDLQTLVDQVISIQRKKGLPENLIVRKNIVKNASLHTDRELMSIVLENSIDNALKSCNNTIGREHFIEINITPNQNGRVSVRVVDNREEVNEYTNGDLFHIFHGSSFENEKTENEKQDLYFVKTAAKKIGGKVNVKKTPEGYNELTLVF